MGNLQQTDRQMQAQTSPVLLLYTCGKLHRSPWQLQQARLEMFFTTGWVGGGWSSTQRRGRKWQSLCLCTDKCLRRCSSNFHSCDFEVTLKLNKLTQKQTRLSCHFLKGYLKFKNNQCIHLSSKHTHQFSYNFRQSITSSIYVQFKYGTLHWPLNNTWLFIQITDLH